MRMTNALILPALVVATVATGAGTASAQLPAPPPLPGLPALPELPPLPSIPLPAVTLPNPVPVGLPTVTLPAPAVPAVTLPDPVPVDLPTVTLPGPSASPPVSEMVAEQVWPDNQTKQDAFNDMANEITVGWANGGQQRMMVGSLVGLAIGCVSIFPNFMAGCILGNLIGAGVGAVTGIDEGNPKARPAVEKFFATP